MVKDAHYISMDTNAHRNLRTARDIYLLLTFLTRFLYKAVLIQESGIRVCNPQPLLFFENFLLEYSVRLHFVSVSEIPVQIDAEVLFIEGPEVCGFFELLFF